MRDFITLYKALLFGHLGLDSLSDGGGKFKRLAAAFFAAVFVVFFVITQVWLFVPIVSAAAEMEYPGLSVELAVMVSAVPGLLFGFFALIRTLLFAGDIALLAPLPVKRTCIFRSKLAYVYTVVFLAVSGVLVPSFIIYSVSCKAGIFFWLRGIAVMVGLPMIILGVLSVISVPVVLLSGNGKRLTAFSKYAGRLVLPLMDAGLAVACMTVGAPGAFLWENWAVIKSWSVPPLSWASLSVFSGGMTSAITMLLFAATVLVCVLVAGAILRRLFVRRVSRVLSTAQDRAMR